MHHAPEAVTDSWTHWDRLQCSRNPELVGFGAGGCSFAAGMKGSGMRKQERTRGKELGRAEPSVIGLNVKHAVTSE